MSQMIERAWYQQASWLKLFRPLSALFTHLVIRRRKRFLERHDRYKAPVPVIVVGNISLGGTGKTPVVLALIDLLRSAGYIPGVVSRGYGGKPVQYPWPVHKRNTPSEVGDEPLLIHRRSNVDLVIDPDRSSAVSYLLQQSDCNVVISDDGLQHYAMQRDIEIAVIDGLRGLGNHRCLPEGPLREPPSRLSEVDFILQNSGDKPKYAGAQIFELDATQLSSLNQSEALSIAQWQQKYAVNSHEHIKVYAVSGIGNPQRFYQTLEQLGFSVIPHAFPDHYVFTETDFAKLIDYPVIMTEKDAVKCTEIAIPNAWVLQVVAKLPETFQQSLLARLSTLTKEGKVHG